MVYIDNCLHANKALLDSIFNGVTHIYLEKHPILVDGNIKKQEKWMNTWSFQLFSQVDAIDAIIKRTPKWFWEVTIISIYSG